MKKFFITTAIAAVIAGSAFANSSKTNDAAAKHLSSEFKNASNIQWKTTNAYTEANFDWNGQKLEAFYDADGNYLGTGKDITVDALPLEAQKTLQNKYSNYTTTSAIQFEDDQNSVNYYVSVENQKNTVILNITPSGEVSVFKKINR